MQAHPEETDAQPFISRWRNAGGSERANYQFFIPELCALLGVALPQPARDDQRDNAYAFERRVGFAHGGGSHSAGFIDCYRRGAFVLEAKKLKAGAHTPGFDDALLRARAQAEGYARALAGSVNGSICRVTPSDPRYVGSHSGSGGLSTACINKTATPASSRSCARASRATRRPARHVSGLSACRKASTAALAATTPSGPASSAAGCGSCCHAAAWPLPGCEPKVSVSDSERLRWRVRRSKQRTSVALKLGMSGGRIDVTLAIVSPWASTVLPSVCRKPAAASNR